MILNFKLPHLNVAGGTKWMLRMCDYFVNEGNQVNILVPNRKNSSWRNFDNMKIIKIDELTNETVPDADVMFTYENCDGKSIMNLSETKGKKILFMQHFGVHNWEKELYNVSLKWDGVVTVANWLSEVAEKFNNTTCNIGIGLNHKMFYPREKELKNCIGMLYHKDEWKGTMDGIKAYHLAKKNNNSLRLLMFGTVAPDFELPKDAVFFLNPPQSLIPYIYSQCDVWVVPTRSEGCTWIGLEAMACGVPLVITNHPGAREYAKHRSNSFVAEVCNTISITDGIMEVLQNEDFKTGIIGEGINTAASFTEKRSFKLLKKYLSTILPNKEKEVEETKNE